MKRLLIIRHAKSSWDYPELTDFDRPLNKRGMRDLPDMAERLVKSGFKVDKIASSPANRAITTATQHAKALGISPIQILQDSNLFHASSGHIQHMISGTNDSIQSLAIVGHNPGLTDLINDLSDFDLWNLPTCGICVIDFNIKAWSEIIGSKGNKVYYDFPKSKHKD